MSSEPSDDEQELNNPELYLNRELGWLSFNERVLDQARDQTWPVLERIKSSPSSVRIWTSSS